MSNTHCACNGTLMHRRTWSGNSQGVCSKIADIYCMPTLTHYSLIAVVMNKNCMTLWPLLVTASTWLHDLTGFAKCHDYSGRLYLAVCTQSVQINYLVIITSKTLKQKNCACCSSTAIIHQRPMATSHSLVKIHITNLLHRLLWLFYVNFK